VETLANQYQEQHNLWSFWPISTQSRTTCGAADQLATRAAQSVQLLTNQYPEQKKTMELLANQHMEQPNLWRRWPISTQEQNNLWNC